MLNCLNAWEIEFLKEKRAELLAEIKRLSGKDQDKLLELMKRLQEISQEITRNHN
jgi:NADH:ubiquinone oxidoreductase subunit E